MKPSNFTTKIFLDSGDPEDTKKMIAVLGFLDGQTTNPSLVAKKIQRSKDPKIQINKLTEKDLLQEYKKIVREISSIIPQGSVSIEVYADKNTTADQMFEQGREMFSWIPNAHVKFPTTHEGLKAAQQAVTESMRVNMTLVFQQEQAAAVYAATRETGSETLPGHKNVFVSPFIGRIDDRGENGMDLIKNITKMYKKGDGHVANLAASIRSLDHLLGSIASGADIITSPISVLEEWAKSGMKIPDNNYSYNAKELKPIAYAELDLGKEWSSFTIKHDLTDAGLQKFADDWNKLLV